LFHLSINSDVVCVSLHKRVYTSFVQGTKLCKITWDVPDFCHAILDRVSVSWTSRHTFLTKIYIVAPRLSFPRQKLVPWHLHYQSVRSHFILRRVLTANCELTAEIKSNAHFS